VVDLSAQPPLSPLAESKRVQIKGLKTKPLTITVPPRYKFRLGPEVGPEGPDACFEGPHESSITARVR